MPAHRKEQGFILVITLWIVVILSLLAIGLGRAISYQTKFTTYRVAKMEARYNAWAGFLYAVAQLAQAKKFLAEDSRNSTKQLSIPSVEDLSWESSPVHLTYTVEEGLLNLNAINHENYQILENLIKSFGYDDVLAKTISISLVDWIDEDKEVSETSFGAEDDYYQNQPQKYSSKNASLNTLEELLFVRGMNQEIFQKLKPFVTVFPTQGRLWIDFERAPAEVLLAAATTFTGAVTNTTADDAKSLVQKMIEFRRGDDGVEGTADDVVLEQKELALNMKEDVIFSRLSQWRTLTPRYWRVRITSSDKKQLARANLEAVVWLDDLSVRYWQRE